MRGRVNGRGMRARECVGTGGREGEKVHARSEGVRRRESERWGWEAGKSG